MIKKQTKNKNKIYEFSAPLPFDFEKIDKIAELNKSLKKSQIVTLFNNIPPIDGLNFNEWIQVQRGKKTDAIKTFDDFSKYVNYAKEKGFHFVYLMNSPKALSASDFEPLKNVFINLLDYLENLECTDIKFANTQIPTLIEEYKPGVFSYNSSTASEYHTISQYDYLIKKFSNLEIINVANDEIFNFKFLKQLRKKYPDKKFEIMVNEPCLRGCPARSTHIASGLFARFRCLEIKKKLGVVYAFFKSGFVYPWHLEYYRKIGINNFKFSAYPSSRYNFQLENMIQYLQILENGVENYTANDFLEGVYASNSFFVNVFKEMDKNIKLADIIPYMPDIKYFLKNGHKCTYNCETDCDYCKQCANEFKEKFLKK